MPDRRKVLSQAGFSLADVYDIEGSIAGIDHVDTHEVHLTHEMGGQVFSERLQSFFRLGRTGDINQNTNFDIDIVGDLGNAITRILSVFVMADTVARTNHCVISLSNNITGREIPIWSWDTADDGETQVRFVDDGAPAAVFFGLRQTGINRLPTLLTQVGSDKTMPRVFLRGATTGFGAGTVEVLALVHLAVASPGTPVPPGAPSSFGLPIPGW